MGLSTMYFQKDVSCMSSIDDTNMLFDESNVGNYFPGFLKMDFV